MPPILSVVVPMFNVEEYVSLCLESLLAQQLEDIEVIVIDDGSTDGCRAVAHTWACKDSRIRLLTQRNAGLSAARNVGIRAARGQYLAFCDSDDVVPSTGYASLVGSLEATGSDIASGDVRRISSAGAHPHPGYKDAFAYDRRRTHIRRYTALVRDRMVWNKVFRRTFWDAKNLTFALPAYEDAPVMMRAHIEASAVDVLSEVVYFWRVREKGEPSITQRCEEPDNIAACMRMVLDAFEVITALAEELIAPYADDMCRGDIRKTLHSLRMHDDVTLRDALLLARSFVMSVPTDVIRALPPKDRKLMELLIRNDLAQIRRILES
ncbi:glycosyltransferase family 2 protein [Streptomyces sp. R28]|uniref:Glycosyltransferase family 2 protein n=1 Tax=Streptomyces sp. R28 TaxID=3238628 RepID=A0AB39QAF1_9ACTN